MPSKWDEFASSEYEIVDLGRPAIFLIPSDKLQIMAGKLTVEEDLHRFIDENFGAHTDSIVPHFGIWRDKDRKIIFDKCTKFEVSFLGKDKIALLLRKLAQIAKLIAEECLYFKAGQYACLVYPK